MSKTTHALVCPRCGLSHPKGILVCNEAKKEMRRMQETNNRMARRCKNGRPGDLSYLGKKISIPF